MLRCNELMNKPLYSGLSRCVMNSFGQNQTVPASWFKRLFLEEIAPLWRRSCVTETGLFHPSLDRQWQRYGDPVATLRSQSRLIYVFATAYRHTGEASYREALDGGAAFLLDHFPDSERGGWFNSCRSDGTVIDKSKDAYGHAFVVFGLSHAARATGNTDYLKGAADAARTLEERFRDEHGGLLWHADADFNSLDEIRSQNTIMHFTEALLALSKAEENPERVEQARRWIDFLFHDCADNQIPLPEDYDLSWHPLPPDEGGRIVLGHQMEWAYLLSHGVELGLPDQYLELGHRCLDAGLRLGLDGQRGGLYRIAVPGRGVTTARKGFWEQAETIRALAHYSARRGRDDDSTVQNALQQTINFYRTFFHDSEYGGVYDSTDPDGSPVKTDKGTEGKLDYHTVGMCTEVMRSIGSEGSQ